MSVHQTSSFLEETAILPGWDQCDIYLAGTGVTFLSSEARLSHGGKAVTGKLSLMFDSNSHSFSVRLHLNWNKEQHLQLAKIALKSSPVLSMKLWDSNLGNN